MMPTASPGLISKEMSFNAQGSSGSEQDTEPDFEASELELKSNAEALHRACGEETYHDFLLYARSLVESGEAAEDIVQQAIANTLTAMKRGVQINNMPGFLYRCVRNLSVNYVSREPKCSPREEIFLVTEQSAASSAELRYRLQKIQDTLDELPSGQRSAFLLAEVRGLRYDEIAEVLNRSTDSVRLLLNRAREKIRARADVGSDWAATPMPVVAADSAPESWYTSLSSNISDWIQPKVSELHTWMGSVSQSCTDSLMQNSTSFATGLAIVAVAAVSPAPSVEQPPVARDMHRAAPTVVSVEDPGPTVSRPHSDTTSTQVGEPAPAPTVVASIPKEVVDRPKVVTKEKSHADKRTVAKVDKSDDDSAANVASVSHDKQIPDVEPQELVITGAGGPPAEPVEPVDPGSCTLCEVDRIYHASHRSSGNGFAHLSNPINLPNLPVQAIPDVQAIPNYQTTQN